MDITEVRLSEPAKKNLKCVPVYIAHKLQGWIDGVKTLGLFEMRKIPGFHDEPLKGSRKGQRSIRLNRAYRAIYVVDETGLVHFIEILEVNKHEY